MAGLSPDNFSIPFGTHRANCRNPLFYGKLRDFPQCQRVTLTRITLQPFDTWRQFVPLLSHIDRLSEHSFINIGRHFVAAEGLQMIGHPLGIE